MGWETRAGAGQAHFNNGHPQVYHQDPGCLRPSLRHSAIRTCLSVSSQTQSLPRGPGRIPPQARTPGRSTLRFFVSPPAFSQADPPPSPCGDTVLRKSPSRGWSGLLPRGSSPGHLLLCGRRPHQAGLLDLCPGLATLLIVTVVQCACGALSPGAQRS